MKKNFNTFVFTAGFSLISSFILACQSNSTSATPILNPLIQNVNNAIQPVLKEYPCPDLANGETEKDCPWSSTAKKMNDQAITGKSLTSEIKNVLPNIWIHPLEDVWGKSINFDENAKGIIVNPAVIEALQEIFQLANDDKAQIINDRQIVHAGMEHTYGYLFSNLKTPYGFKRERYVSGEIEKGLNLPAGILGPNPSDGNLFTNVTYFLGHIAFRNISARLNQIEREKKYSAKVLHNYDFSKLKVSRLEETIILKDTDKPRKVVLNTDFVEFPSPQKNAYLLVYSVTDSNKNKTELITGFPVEKYFVEKALNPEKIGENLPVITRYNAYVSGVTGLTTITGQRKLAQVDFLKF